MSQPAQSVVPPPVPQQYRAPLAPMFLDINPTNPGVCPCFYPSFFPDVFPGVSHAVDLATSAVASNWSANTRKVTKYKKGELPDKLNVKTVKRDIPVRGPAVASTWSDDTREVMGYKTGELAKELRKMAIKRDISIRGKVKAKTKMIYDKRDSYRNAGLAFCVGDITDRACTVCEKGNGPYTECVVVADFSRRCVCWLLEQLTQGKV